MSKYELKVRVLGYWGAFPKAGEACSGVLIQAGKKNFLFDMGCGVYSKLLKKIDVRDLNGIFISHWHYDHMSDLGTLKYNMSYRRRIGEDVLRLGIYAPQSSETEFSAMNDNDFFRINTVQEGVVYDDGEVKVTACHVEHTIECYAYCLEAYGRKVVYYTDTIYRPQDIDFIKNADLFICEATITEGSKHTTGNGHMSDIEAGMLAREAKVKAMCLYHLPSDIDVQQIYENVKKEYKGTIIVPHKKCKIELV